MKTYSGGMRRRLDLAGALVADPSVLFLDEPTTGLDPRGRNDMWDVIKDLVSGGTTLLLTTQYMEEAEQLADNIVVIDRGQIIAEGTADQLKSQVGGERLEVVVADAARLDEARELLTRVGYGRSDHGRAHAHGSACRWAPARPAWSRRCGTWTAPASRSATSRCAARRWTTCSSP